MDWDRYAKAHRLLESGSVEESIVLLRDLRRRYPSPAVAPLLARALASVGEPEAAERLLAEDCFIGIADHWSWLGRADLAMQSGNGEIASLHRARAYELLGWPGCSSRGYSLEHDEISQLLPRWGRVFALLLAGGGQQVLSVHGGTGVFALWALDWLEQHGGTLTSHGRFHEPFHYNLATRGSAGEAGLHGQLDSTPTAQHGPWDVIHLGPLCKPEEGWQEQLRPLLKPEGVLLADDPGLLRGEEIVWPGVVLAGWRAEPAGADGPSDAMPS
ncbi:MAG: hypothetical protein ACKO8I_15300 [Cyanobacteriota bacterium]